MSKTDQEQFRALIAEVTATIAGADMDDALAAELNRRFPAGDETFERIRAACHEAIAAGWMCAREAGGIKYGRVIDAGPDTHGFSVDVVHMDDLKGPYHRHPTGEIDMVMPIDAEAQFDGHGEGWCVYGPDSAHYPTVSGGAAVVLYLLPDGAIDFKAKPPA
ncbi:DUF4863 family protein [Haliangium sp.]|uniref:4-hydroxylaminobenzoate lyase n=1 Tax=Haliangium sp. TaxID=2663208 RepID=UPI003D0C7526